MPASDSIYENLKCELINKQNNDTDDDNDDDYDNNKIDDENIYENILINNKQRPSIVVELYNDDENIDCIGPRYEEPITPKDDDNDLCGAVAAAVAVSYFHQTIEDDDDDDDEDIARVNNYNEIDDNYDDNCINDSLCVSVNNSSLCF